MTPDNSTLTDSINAVCENYKQDPNCLTKHDLNNLDMLKREANWLLVESYQGPMNSPRHHQVFDRMHALLRKLEKKCADYHYQKKWRGELLRQSKYNPYHKPAGSPEGGEFDFAPGGGGSGDGSGGSPSDNSSRFPSDDGNTGANNRSPLFHPVSYDATQKAPRPPKQMSVSKEGVRTLVQHENFRSHVYLDTGKKPTIGYGHLIKPGESFPNGITEAEAQELFLQDLHEAQGAVRRYVSVDLTQPQFDALTSFTYNVGAGSFRDSTLLRYLNTGNHVAAANEFLKWNKVKQPDGSFVVDEGVINRRREEETLFRSGIPDKKPETPEE